MQIGHSRHGRTHVGAILRDNAFKVAANCVQLLIMGTVCRQNRSGLQAEAWLSPVKRYFDNALIRRSHDRK
jgi:hypothetical protein